MFTEKGQDPATQAMMLEYGEGGVDMARHSACCKPVLCLPQAHLFATLQASGHPSSRWPCSTWPQAPSLPSSSARRW
jgi:hypothetical protein